MTETQAPTTDHMSPRPWNLAELTYHTVRDGRYDVAVLPLGATEPHNLHLPYGTDTLEADHICDALCRAAWERGAKVVLLPTIPYGTQTNQRACPLSMNVNPSTLFALVTDLVDSLVGHGITKILLLNSHGGNEFKPLLRELYGKTAAHVFLCNWYQVIKDVEREVFVERDDHAGEMETSLILAVRPDLVRRDEAGRLAADDGKTALTRFEAVNRGWVSITRPWHLLTTNTGAGNPHAATPEKGRRVIEILVERLAGFLVELSRAEVDERFPY